MNKAELTKKCEDLGIDTKDLDTNAKLQDAITAKEAELADLDVDTDTQETEKATEQVVFEFNKNKYTFSELCPKKLQVNNEVFTQEELLKQEDALQFLIVGNSPFIKRVR